VVGGVIVGRVSTDPIRLAAGQIDLSQRFVMSNTVAGSPAAASETIIAQVTVAQKEAIFTGVFLFGQAAWTVGTNGTSCRLRLRQTNASGTIVGDSGLVDAGVAAAKLENRALFGLDASPSLPNQVYVLTLTVTAGSAASTVSEVGLAAIAV